MDDSSKNAFGKMADCVVQEYNNFCPLNKTEYGTAACLDGAQTQGENIADNGGIHAAFRAYRNFINLYGPDPQLPDDLLQEFTNDQLFFLAFSQVWCQSPPRPSQIERQILVDPHSPSQYRVWGTIQNFPAFKDAFHCPSSAYAPDQHCDVWVSDIESSYGEPVVKGELNIRPNNMITTSDIDKYNAYKQAVDFY
ncbi:peptidase family M13, partial [Ostertagia ostertagi]